MKCDNCGGESSSGASFCQYCGAAASLTGDSLHSRIGTFERIKASPLFQQAQAPDRLEKLPKPSGAPKALFKIFSILIAGKVALVIAGFLLAPIAIIAMLYFMWPIFQTGMHHDPSTLSLALDDANRGLFRFLIFVVPCMIFLFVAISVGLGFAARHFSSQVFSNVFHNLEALEKAPIEVLPAIVVAKRTDVRGGIGNHAASTRYFVTFELEDGARKEYALWYGTMFGRIVEDDAGVLFTRGDFAADFDRISAQSR